VTVILYVKINLENNEPLPAANWFDPDEVVPTAAGNTSGQCRPAVRLV